MQMTKLEIHSILSILQTTTEFVKMLKTILNVKKTFWGWASSPTLLSLFAAVDGKGDDVRVYHLHTPFNAQESNHEHKSKPTRKDNKIYILGSVAEMLHPHLTFDLRSASSRECKSQPWAHGWKAEVRELRHGAGEELGHDHMHVVPAAGHDRSRIQTWDVCVAHVLTLHLLRVGAWPRPLPGRGLQGNHAVCSNVRCSAAGWCCAAAWSPSSWTTSRMCTTNALTARGCSTLRRNNAANDETLWRRADRSHGNMRPPQRNVAYFCGSQIKLHIGEQTGKDHTAAALDLGFSPCCGNLSQANSVHFFRHRVCYS